MADFRAQMDQASRAVEGVGKKTQQSSQEATTALGRLTRSAQDNRQSWDTAGTALAGFGAVTVAGLGATVRAAVQWESAWAGVTKTVSGTPQELQRVEDGLRNLTRTMPAAHGEIAAVAEAAGQLGVQTGSIVGFTKTMIDLGETTNLSAEEAATSLAQLMNVMQTAPEDVGRLGASLVALGNAGASTEADIVNMASYITGSAKLIGASESDVLALANAMSSMGINAERGGGVMTRVMQDVYAAVQTGGDKLNGFAEVAGMSASDFAAAFEADPIRAIDSFVRGLDGVKASGGNVVATLGELGYKGTQDTAVLLQMAGAGDLLTDSLDLGNQAWAENTALVQEAAKRYDTTASQLAIARNGINDAAITIGETFLPILADLAGKVASVAGWFADLPAPIQEAVGGLAGVAGVAALAGGAFLLLFPRVIDTVSAFRQLRDTNPGVADSLGKVGKAAGIAGIVFAAATAVDALIKSMGPAPATMEDTTAALLGMGDSLEDVDALFRAQSNWSYEVDGLADAAGRLADPSLLDRMNDFGGELLSLGSNEGSYGRTRVIEQLNGMGESLGLMVEQGNADLAARQFEMLAAEWERGGGTVAELRDLMPGYDTALQAVANQQDIAGQTAAGLAGSTEAVAGALSGVAPAVESTYSSLGAYAAALGYDEEATQELIDRSNELGSTLADFVNPLDAYTGLLEEKRAAEQAAAEQTAAATESTTDSWEDYVNDVTVSFGEYMTRLEEQVAAQSNWQVNMLALAGRVSQGTIDELARMGPEGARLVADLVNRSDAELDRFDDITYLRSKEATDAWGAQLTLAAPVLAQVGRTAGQGVVAELAAQLQAGTITVAQIAAQYGIDLANGINPVLTSLGKPAIVLTGANRVGGPGVNVRYADGGFEDHTAQIAPAGPLRMWAEPETGGEAYIPLSPAKRGRSLDIWRETGRRLGQDVEAYADGGIVALGRRLQAMGARVTEHPAFGGVAMGAHGLTSLHYSGDAIDVNTRAGTSTLEQSELAPMAALARSLGFRTIFMAPGHYNHLHADTGRGPSMGGAAAAAPAVVLPKPPSTAPFGSPISTGADTAMRAAYDAAQAYADSIGPPTATLSGGNVPAGEFGVRAAVQAAAARRGWGSGPQWDALSWIIGKESGWNPSAQNPTSTASGLFQHINSTWNAYKPAGVAASRMRDATPAQQAEAGMSYFGGRYGTPVGARAFWERNRYYAEGGILNPHVRDAGGPLLPGYTFNGTGAPETVVPNRVVDSAAVSGASRVVQETNHYHRYDVDVRASGDADAQARAVAARLARQERRVLAGV